MSAADEAKELAELRRFKQTDAVRTEVRAVAQAAGVRNPRDIDLLDLSGLTNEATGPDGTIDSRAINAFVTTLKAEKAYWFAEAPKQTQTPPNSSEKPQPVDWKKLSRSEYQAAEARLFAEMAAESLERAAAHARGPRELTAAEKQAQDAFSEQFKSPALREYEAKMRQDRKASN